MGERAADEPTVSVHGFLICRNVVQGEAGRLDLEDVLEIIPLEALPGDAGPLVFVAFVRGLAPGAGEGAFVIRPAGSPQELARLPVSVTVPEGLASRQVALQVRVPSMPVKTGGWYEVDFAWQGRVLARNRFAVGARS